MVDKQAAVLIFENIAMLEDAVKLIDEELSEQVFRAIDKTISHWVRTIGWDGQFKFWSSDSGTYFGPRQWKLGAGERQDEQWIACFEIDGDDPDDEYWLTLLLAARQGRIGFTFSVNYADHLSIRKAEWKNFARARNRRHPELEAAGFSYDPKSGTWFLPWQIDPKVLAEAYANDAIEDAFGPLTEALKRIETASAVFLELVEAARRELGQRDDA